MEAVKAVFIHRQHDCLYRKSNIIYKNLLDLQSEFSEVVFPRSILKLWVYIAAKKTHNTIKN